MAERRAREEDALQIAVVELLLLNGYWPVHVPNQGWRSRAGAGILKRMGLWPGFPDLIVFNRLPPSRAAPDECRYWPQVACTIELKRPRKRLKSGGLDAAKKPTREQVETHKRLEELGVPNLVATSLEEVIDGMSRLGHPLKARVIA